MKKVKAPKEPFPKCHVCGDRGKVPASYLSKWLGVLEGMRLVACPKCTKTTEEKTLSCQTTEPNR